MHCAKPFGHSFSLMCSRQTSSSGKSRNRSAMLYWPSRAAGKVGIPNAAVGRAGDVLLRLLGNLSGEFKSSEVAAAVDTSALPVVDLELSVG